MSPAMKTMDCGFARMKAVLCLLFAAITIGFTIWAGGTAQGILLFWAAVATHIVLPGIFWVWLLRLDRRMPRFVPPLAILLGTGQLLVLFCISARIHNFAAVRGLPLLFAAGCLWMWYRNGHRKLACLSRSWYTPARRTLALLTVWLVFCNTFASVIKRALPSVAGDVLIDQDFLWMVGNAKSFLLEFPPQDIRFYNVRLAYHYLTEMLCAAMSAVTGLDCYQIMGFYMQPAMLLALVICLYRLACIFYREDERKTVLFPCGLFFFSCAGLWTLLPNGLSPFGNSNITHLLTNITSQATAVLYLCIFFGLWLHLAEKNFRMDGIEFILMLCSFVMLTVGKGPVGGIVLLGACAAAPFLIWQKKFSLRGGVLLVGLAGVFAVLYAMLFSAGANGGMALDFSDSVMRTPLAAFLQPLNDRYPSPIRPMGAVFWLPLLLLMAPAVFLPWLISVFRALRHLGSLSAGKLLAHACAAGGVLAFLIFRHPHFSQVYFFLLGLFFMDLLAVDVLPGILQKRKWTGRICSLLIGVSLLSSVFYYVHVGGSGLRYFLRDVGVLEKYPYDTVINVDDEAAGLWLRDNTPPAGTRFATNRVHSDNGHADGVSNIYTALSGRQATMEGYTYVADVAPWMWVDARKELNRELFDPHTEPQRILELCRAHDITHLVFSSQMQGGTSDEHLHFLDCVFHSPTVRIYEVTESEEN